MNPVLVRLHSERSRLLDMCDEIATSAEGEERDLSETELGVITRNRTRVEDELDPQIETIEQLESVRLRHNVAASELVAEPRTSTSTAVASAEEIVYRSYAQYARDELIRRFDGVAQAVGPNARAQAVERLDRAVAHTLTTDVAGLIVPQHLGQIIELIDKSRPIVESSRRVGLTSGKLQYPSLTQRPQVGKQTAEKTEAPSRKMTVVMLDVIADTYVGAGNLSWQAINWSTPDALSLWFDLAAEQYAQQTEAATGTVLAATTATTELATNDLAGWMAAIVSGAGTIYGATRRSPDTLWLAPDVGFPLMGFVSTAAPVFLPGGSLSISARKGSLAGVSIIISGGLPAGTSVLGVSGSLLTAETPGAPVELRAVEPAIGGMEVGIIGAFVAKATEAAAFVKIVNVVP